MADNTTVATKSSLQAAFSSASSLPLLVPSAPAHSHFSGSQSQASAGGMKLEAVMENLQKQQAARLALEEQLRQAEKEKEMRSMVKSRLQQQALSFRPCPEVVRGSFTAGYPDVYAAAGSAPLPRPADDSDAEDDGRDTEEDELEDELEDGRLGHEESSRASARWLARDGRKGGARPQPQPPQPHPAVRGCEADEQPQQHEWTYEEQFKQSGELSSPGTDLGDRSFSVSSGSSSSIQEDFPFPAS